jgi:hypothetical protein
MLPLFRKIRFNLAKNNQFFNYSRYAVGEIILVVIGILIALQISTWNKSRVAKAEEIKLYKKIIDDLDTAEKFTIGQLDYFNDYQEMHHQIFNESKGLATYDPETRYQELRWTGNYNAIITENHSGDLSIILNQRVRSALNDFLKEEQQTITSFDLWATFKMDRVMPFIENNNILDAEVIFAEVDFDWNNIIEDKIETLNHDQLKIQYGSQELDQILAMLYLRTGYVIHRLKVQLEQIDKFKNILEDAAY